MTIEQWISTGLGIFVSIVLFLVTYRQTLGARRERGRAATEAVERSVLRRVVQENYNPKRDELRLLVEGFANEYRIRTEDIVPPSQVLRTLYARVSATDLIAPADRGGILERLGVSIAEIDKEPGKELGDRATSESWPFFITATLGVVASILGALVASYKEALSSIAVLSKTFTLSVFGTSLAVVALLAVLLRFREYLFQPAPSSTREGSTLEHEVYRIFRRFGFRPEIGGPRSGYDFSVDLANSNILVEIKAWPSRLPIELQKRLQNQLEVALTAKGADEAWVILPNSASALETAENRVRFLTLRGLHNHLSEMKKAKLKEAKTL